jgi:[ribosomal protein S5]-alanine N-acetyltransferase
LTSSIRTERLVLEPIDPEVIRLLIRGDRAAAQQEAARKFPDEFPTADELAGFLPIQLKRMEDHPHRRGWMARLMVSRDGEVIGHCGFHGPPDIIGRAEIGYTVFKPFRGRGFAKEAAEALIQWAFTLGEERVFASVSPDNGPSLAVIRHLGFVQVGSQEDEVDGLELVFAIERPSP